MHNLPSWNRVTTLQNLTAIPAFGRKRVAFLEGCTSVPRTSETGCRGSLFESVNDGCPEIGALRQNW